MNEVFFSVVYTVFFLLEFIPAVFVLIADRNAPQNRSFALLYFVLAFNSLSYGALTGVFSLEEALPWMAVFVITTYMIGPAVYIGSVGILRPRWFRHRWLFWPVYFLLVLPIFVVLLDVTGISAQFLPEPLIFTPPSPDLYAGGVVTLGDTAIGLISRYMLIVQIGFPTLATICPMLVVAIKDWKANPDLSRIAMLLLLATGIASVSQGLVAVFIDPVYTSMFASLGFILLVALAVTRRRTIPWNLSAMRRALDDWPVFAKLVLIVVTVFIPTILIIIQVTGSVVRTNMTTQLGNSFNALARLEARSISDSLRIQITNLDRLSQSTVLQSTLNARARETGSLEETALRNWLIRQEFDWVTGDASLSELLPSEFTQSVSVLDEFQENFPAFSYLQLTDANGGLVTATSAPTHFDFSNAGWWRAAYNEGSGQTYVSVPLRDPESDRLYLEIALPITGSSGTVLGVVMAHYDMSDITANLASTRIGNRGHSDLFSPGGILVPIESDTIHAQSERDVQLPWNELLNDPTRWRILVYEGTSSIVSWTTVGAAGMTDPIEPLQWRITVHQPVAEALETVATAQRATLFTAVITSILALAFAWVLSGFITQPISSLTTVAQRVLDGDLEVRADINSADEIGMLAATFNTMTSQLRGLISNLENQVRARTADLEDQTEKLQAAADVGQGVISILEVDDLIDTTVEIIRDRFNLYYVGLFLVNEDRSWAVLKAGTGEAGEKMMAREHRLRIGEGMIGWSVAHGQSRVAGEAAQDNVRLLTPELPETRSEAAVPLRARGQTLGALTVQSTHPNEFDPTTLSILQSVADQVGIAIDNARLLEENRKALADSRNALETVRRTYQQVTREAWTDTTRRQQWALVATQDGIRWQHEEAAIERADEPSGNDTGELAVPIRIRSNTVGTIRLRRPPGTGEWTPQESQYVESYVNQLGLALDSARLFQDIQNRSVQLEVSAEVGRAASSILQLDELLPATVQLISNRFDLYYAGIFLLDDDEKWAVLKSGSGEAGRQQLEAGHRLEVGGQSMVGQCIATGEARIAMDVGAEAVRFENPILPDTRTEMALPLIAAGKTIGALTIQSTRQAAFSREDITVFQTMANQLATAIRNAQLYEQSTEATSVAQEQRRIADALLKSASRFSRTRDQEAINQILLEEIDSQIRPDQINILLWEEGPRRFRVARRFAPGDAEDDYKEGQLVAPADRQDLMQVFTESAHIYNPEKREDGTIHEQYRLPLLLGDQPIGVVEIFHTAQDAHISEEDRAVIDGIVQQAAVSVQSARAFRETEEALSRTEALYRVGQAAIAMENRQQLLQSVANTIADSLPADRVLITTLDMGAQKVTGFVQSHVPAHSVRPLTYEDLMKGLTGRSIREQKWVIVQKPTADAADGAAPHRARPRVGSRLVVPLLVRGRALGAIAATNDLDKPNFTDRDAELLVAMALQTAVALQNNELLAETQKTAQNEQLLNQIGSQLISSLDFETILRTAVEEIGQLPNITNVTLTVDESKPRNGDPNEE